MASGTSGKGGGNASTGTPKGTMPGGTMPGGATGAGGRPSTTGNKSGGGRGNNPPSK